MKQVITFSYEDDSGTQIKHTINSMKSMEEVFEDFTRFLLAIGYSSDSVSTIRCSTQEDENLCIMRDRIKSALDCLGTKDVESAINHLSIAYES